MANGNCPLGQSWYYNALNTVPTIIAKDPAVTVDVFGNSLRFRGGAPSGPGGAGSGAYTANYQDLPLGIGEEWRYAMTVVEFEKRTDNGISFACDAGSHSPVTSTTWIFQWSSSQWRIRFGDGSVTHSIPDSFPLPLKIEVRETKLNSSDFRNAYLYVNDTPAASQLNFSRGGFFITRDRARPSIQYHGTNAACVARLVDMYVVGYGLPATCFGEAAVGAAILPDSTGKVSHARILLEHRSEGGAQLFHNKMKEMVS